MFSVMSLVEKLLRGTSLKSGFNYMTSYKRKKVLISRY